MIRRCYRGREFGFGPCVCVYSDGSLAPFPLLVQGADSPEAWQVIVSCLLILTFGSLAAGAGVGGGGLFVPIYALILGVGGKPAVPLSKCTILGAAIGNFVSIGFQRHPTADRPLIDYEVSTLMQAGELLGVTVGVMLNLLLPEVVIMIFLAILLSYNAYKTLLKGRQKYRKESEDFAKAAQKSLEADEGNVEAPGGDKRSDKGSSGSDDLLDTAARAPALTQAQLETRHALHTAALARAQAELKDFLGAVCLDHKAQTFHDYGIDTVPDLEECVDSPSGGLGAVLAEVGLSSAELAALEAAVADRKAERKRDSAPDFDAMVLDDELLGFSKAMDETASPQSSSSGSWAAEMPTAERVASSGRSSGSLRELKASSGQSAQGEEERKEAEEQQPATVDKLSGQGLVQQSAAGSGAEPKGSELAQLYKDAAVQFPTWAYAAVIGMTLFTVFYAIMKKEVLTPCLGPAAFWVWNFSAVPVLGVCMFLIGRYLNGIHEQREAAGYLYLDTDIQFTKEQLGKFPVTAVNAGLAAGLLGIGGGMVIGPLFIEIGMQPQVGTSSCAYMILWTAVSGVVQYYYAGKLGWQFMLFFMAFGFISGQIGQRMVNRLLKWSGRPSLVVILLGCIIGLACVVMTTSTAASIATSSKDEAELFALELDWTTCGYWKHR